MLVVTGEASGDQLAARVLRQLGAASWGIAGPESARAGLHPVGELGPRDLGAMGLWPVLKRAPQYASLLLTLRRCVLERRPKTALLVGFSDFNQRLGAWLRKLGIWVLWLAPPQVWAWRHGRARAVARAADHLALLLPFEVPFWRYLGATGSYVGHPAMEAVAEFSERPRRHVLVLPGSRPQEVDQNLDAMLAAVARVAPPEVRVVVSGHLPPEHQARVRRRAESFGFSPVDGPAPDHLAEARVALTVSGTASLECALAGVPPVIVYSTGKFRAAAARRLLSVPYIGLPNLILGSARFPEHLGPLDPEALARDLMRVDDEHESFVDSTRTVRARLALPNAETASGRVADLLRTRGTGL